MREPVAIDGLRSAARASLTVSPEPEMYQGRKLQLQDDSALEEGHATRHRGVSSTNSPEAKQI